MQRKNSLLPGLLGLLLLATTGVARAAERPIPPAPGPYVGLQPGDMARVPSFSSTQRLVGTYYFYWYDAPSKAHILDGDGTDALTTHPPTLEGLSYKSVAWHRRQLEDMIAAGIDVLLPVFWGAPSEHTPGATMQWSYEGLAPLVRAREELLQAGKNPPRIGMFYDTSTLQYNSWHEHQDLTTPRGHAWFYATVRDFFSLIPPKHWALMDGKPIILLYSAAFAKKHDQGVVDYLRKEFPKEFGGRGPWLAREVSWQVRADSVVAWGGALGAKNPGGVASVGPGYDHSAVPGRTPLVAERRHGAFYEEQWIKVLRRPANFVMVETWNEWHEGTDVAESREYGRQYIELTRKYADLHRQGWRPAWPDGPYRQAAAVQITLGPTNVEHGLKLVDNEDGKTESVPLAQRSARRSQPGVGAGRYLYFVVDDSFKTGNPTNFTVQVEYFDAAPGQAWLEYDGSDEAAPFSGAYTRCPQVIRTTGSQIWRTNSFRLTAARLNNGQNRGADLRLAVESPGLGVGRVTLSR